MMKKWQWITNKKVVVDLMNEPFLLMQEVSGHVMPPFRRDERWIGQMGIITGIRADAREVFLPLLVRSNNLQEAMRLCAQYWNPLDGDGNLRVIDDSNHVRILKCRYVDGLEGDGRNSGSGWQKIGLRLRALQPYWQDEEYQDFMFVMAPPVVFFQTAFFPLHISKSSIDGSLTVNNPGEVEAYPIIIVQGPLTSLELKNLTMKPVKTMTFPILTMSASDVLVINTSPDMMSVTINGINAFSLMSASSSLWTVIPGSNQVQITTTGTSENSYLRFSFVPQYLTV